jgi:hypothetical protein
MQPDDGAHSFASFRSAFRVVSVGRQDRLRPAFAAGFVTAAPVYVVASGGRLRAAAVVLVFTLSGWRRAASL